MDEKTFERFAIPSFREYLCESVEVVSEEADPEDNEEVKRDGAVFARNVKRSLAKLGVL